MKSKPGLLCLISGFLPVPLASQSWAAETRTAAVDDARCEAVLSGRQIRLHRPLTAAAPESASMLVRLPSPEDEALPAVREAVAAGAGAADRTVPWPLDKKGEPADPIHWHRVACESQVHGRTTARDKLALASLHGISSAFWWRVRTQ